MKIMKKAAFLACLCCTLFSCSNVEKKAGEKLQAAREAFERGDYSEAKIQIDSIKILYPKAFETRREGIGLMQQVELKEQEKTLVYLDSMLQEKQKEVDTIKPAQKYKLKSLRSLLCANNAFILFIFLPFFRGPAMESLGTGTHGG